MKAVPPPGGIPDIRTPLGGNPGPWFEPGRGQNWAPASAPHDLGLSCLSCPVVPVRDEHLSADSIRLPHRRPSARDGCTHAVSMPVRLLQIRHGVNPIAVVDKRRSMTARFRPRRHHGSRIPIVDGSRLFYPRRHRGAGSCWSPWRSSPWWSAAPRWARRRGRPSTSRPSPAASTAPPSWPMPAPPRTGLRMASTTPKRASPG